MNDNDVVRVFLFANIGSTTDMNLWIIKSTFRFIKNSMRLNESFFLSRPYFLSSFVRVF